MIAFVVVDKSIIASIVAGRTQHPSTNLDFFDIFRSITGAVNDLNNIIGFTVAFESYNAVANVEDEVFAAVNGIINNRSIGKFANICAIAIDKVCCSEAVDNIIAVTGADSVDIRRSSIFVVNSIVACANFDSNIGCACAE